MLALQTMQDAVRRGGLANAVLLMAGDGPERDEVARRVREMDLSERVRLIGAVEQQKLARLMQASKAFLLTSEWEGGGMVVFEALGSGLPVVSLPVGHVPQIVQHGSTGWIADEGSEAAMADGLASGLEWAVRQHRDALAERCVASVSPFRVREVLEPFYEAHRVALSGG